MWLCEFVLKEQNEFQCVLNRVNVDVNHVGAITKNDEYFVD